MCVCVWGGIDFWWGVGEGESTVGNFSRWGRVSKFLAGEGNPPPSSPVGKTL